MLKFKDKMKTQINEIRRMQELAGIINEAIGDDIALKSSNTKPNIPREATPGVSPTSTVNTSDEIRLRKALELSNIIKARLGDIGDNVNELDGFFKVVLDYTSIDDIPKSQIISALTKALKELEPNQSTITTSIAKVAKK